MIPVAGQWHTAFVLKVSVSVLSKAKCFFENFHLQIKPNANSDFSRAAESSKQAAGTGRRPVELLLGTKKHQKH